MSMMLKYNDDDGTPITPCSSDTTISVKILCRDEFRRFKIHRSENFDNLARQVETMFLIAKNENVHMKFTDDEGSRCTLSNDAELAEAYNIVLSMPKQILYIDLIVDTKQVIVDSINYPFVLSTTNIREESKLRKLLGSFIKRIKNKNVDNAVQSRESCIPRFRPYKSVALTNVNIQKSGLGNIKINLENGYDIESTLALDTQTTDSLCAVV